MNNYSYEEAKNSAAKHERISQYTDFDALQYIITNKSLQLTRVDCVNDLTENQGLIPLWEDKIYVSCFTNREYESYFFWKTYPRNKEEGIMFSLNLNSVNDLPIHPDSECKEECLLKYNKTDLTESFSPDISAKKWCIYDYSCLDVSYIPRDHAKEIDNFQGRIKYLEWDIEAETRIRVAVRPKGPEISFRNKGAGYFKPNNECIYARLTDECIQSMIVTLSPLSDERLRKRVEKLIESNGLAGKILIKDSVLSKEINKEKEHKRI